MQSMDWNNNQTEFNCYSLVSGLMSQSFRDFLYFVLIHDSYSQFLFFFVRVAYMVLSCTALEFDVQIFDVPEDKRI